MWSDEFISANKKKKFDLMVVINASPFEIDKFEMRKSMAKKNTLFFKSPLIYLNLVGSQDELVFDGGSFVMNKFGKVVSQEEFFVESENIVDTDILPSLKAVSKKTNNMETLYKALMISLENYAMKNNFKSAIIGLSGGIDSAICLTIAADVLGKENVNPYFLPSIFTSFQSKEDAFKISRNLGVKIQNISIETLRKMFEKELSFLFNNLPKDITEENIQSRIRGMLLMAISNKFDSLLISTGNKSELAVGYATLYGDMCGGFSLIKDLYKTQIIELSNWRNENILDIFKIKQDGIIPKSIILKEPTAELKPNQKDSDTLPPYNILDKILELLIDKNLDLKSIEKKGFDKVTVGKIWKMIKTSEYKRYQSAIGPKVSGMSFDKDRRFPITNNFLI